MLLLLKTPVLVYFITWFIMQPHEVLGYSKQKDLVVRRVGEKHRPKPNDPCSRLKIYTDGNQCLARVWDMSNQLIGESEGISHLEMCYSSSSCYYVEIGSDDGNICRFNVTTQEDSVSQGDVRGDNRILVRVGTCSSPICGKNEEMFVSYHDSLPFTHDIVDVEENTISPISSPTSTSSTSSTTSAIDNSKSICIDMNECNAFVSVYGPTGYYYFIDEEEVEGNKFDWYNSFLVVGNCCGEMDTLGLYSQYGDNSYTLDSIDGKTETGYIYRDNYKILCIDKSQCNLLTANLYYSWEGTTGRTSDDITTFGNCSATSTKHALSIRAKSGGFNYTLHVDDEVIEKYIEEGDFEYVPIDSTKCNTINGTGNATYTLYRHDEQLMLDSEGDHLEYSSFGKCSCNYKSLFLSSSTRGQDIIRLLSSIWGMEVFINVTSPQYTTACWLINHDPKELHANDTNIVQRYVLALLFYSTDGWNWNKGYYFLSGKHECDWIGDGEYYGYNGVLCNTEDHVRAIYLSYNNLSGMLVSEIYSLTDLENLYLPFNRLSGSLPFGISQMQLKKLHISDNNFEGALPDDFFSIKSIETIHMNSNKFSGPLPNVDIDVSSLVYLLAKENKINGSIPDWIGRAPRLVRMDLSFNDLTGTIPERIVGLTELEFISLESNQLSGALPSNLFTSTTLRYIYFSNNYLNGMIPTEFAANNKLSELRLDHNQLSGTIPTNIFNFPELGWLYLSNNKFNGNLSSNRIDFKSLRQLTIDNNFITGTISNCDDTMISADCGTPKKIKCECCKCYGTFNNPTSYEIVSPCPSSELQIFSHNEIKAELYFEIYNDNGEVILQDDQSSAKLSNLKYAACISETDCFTFINDSDGAFDLLINNITIATISTYNVSFGYSTSQPLAINTCEDIKICNTTLTQGTYQRRMLNDLFKIYYISNFIDTSSLHYQALCWWLEDLEHYSEQDNTQRYAIVLLYYSTNGEQWNQNEHWLIHNKTECQWYGIKCNGYDSIVINIDLSSNNLDGTIPTEIGELKGLEILILSSNGLTGSLPQEIGKLENLKELKLSSNELKGHIPSHIRFLRYLKELDLSSNVFTHTIPLEIEFLKTIEILKLSNNSFSGELSSQIQSLSNLKVLNVSKNLFQGNMTALKKLEHLRQIDLSNNYFTGSSPIFGATHDKLEILHINGNTFSGSIPTEIGDMLKLEEMLLHNNRLRGTLPTEIGRITNILNMSISYNGIKGTIPTEIKNLTKLKLLHLHSNQLEGTADHFDDNHSIESFISDCGNTATEERLVDCKTCTECCNEEEECITEINTWPRNNFKNIKTTWKLQNSAIGVLILLFFGWLSMIPITIALFRFRQILPKSSYLCNYGHQFQIASVYRFYLSSNKLGWFISCLTTMFQLLIILLFFHAGDKAANTNEWVSSVTCPKDSTECHNTRQVDAAGWLIFAGIIALFVIPDILDGLCLFYTSSTCKKIDVKGAIFGVLILSVPVLSIVASTIYLYATSISNAVLLKDSIAILFLSQIDEQVSKVVVQVAPSWAKKIEKDIAERYHEHASIVKNGYLENEILEVIDNTAIDVVEEQSPPTPDSSNTSLDGSNNIDSFLRHIQEIKKNREVDKQLIFEMWNILSCSNAQPDDLNSAQMAGVSISSRQVMVQSFHSKIEHSYFESKTSEVIDNTAIDVVEEQSPPTPDSSNTSLDGSNNIDSLLRHIQEIKKNREVDKQLIFEMWNILSCSNAQPDDLNSAQMAGVSISSRQVMVQSFHSKIEHSYFESKTSEVIDNTAIDVVEEQNPHRQDISNMGLDGSVHCEEVS